MGRFSILAVGLVVGGCGGDGGGGSADTGPIDSGPRDAGSSADSGPTGDDSGAPCGDDAECDDGLFCNGVEACVGGRCAPGTAVDCADDRDCTRDECSESLRDCTHQGPDEDDDGHVDVTCGGDDCDDTDPLRYVGADEECDAANRDEDCNPTTFGVVDDDMDGFPAARCCNGDTCGSDCDDTSAAISPSDREICDGLGRDEDCDGLVDDADGCMCSTGASRPCGLMGACSGGVEPCVDGAWGACTISPVAEICNGLDDDCDGTIPPGETDADADGISTCEGDCYDMNAAAQPGASGWYNTDRGDGSFDYDCSGAEEVQYPEVGRCRLVGTACTFAPGWTFAVAGCGGRADYATDMSQCLRVVSGTMTRCAWATTIPSRQQLCH